MPTSVEINTNPLDAVTAYLSAGGRGSRLASSLASHPQTGIAKALVEVGSPRITMIDHHINNLLHAGFTNIIVGAGDQAQVVEHMHNRYDDSRVQVVASDRQYGIGGDLLRALRSTGLKAGKLIFMQNVDTILDIDHAAFVTKHRRRHAPVTFALTLQDGVPNDKAFQVDYADRVISSAEIPRRPSLARSAANVAVAYSASSTGAVLVERDFALQHNWQPEDGYLSLSQAFLSDALSGDWLNAYNNGRRFFLDIGTPASLALAQQADSPVQPYLSYDS